MPLKHWIAGRRLVLLVTDLLVRGKHEFWMKHMLIALIKLVLAFYAIATAENLLIYGADVSNAFAEAPPPKLGFYIYPDRVFKE